MDELCATRARARRKQAVVALVVLAVTHAAVRFVVFCCRWGRRRGCWRRGRGLRRRGRDLRRRGGLLSLRIGHSLRLLRRVSRTLLQVSGSKPDLPRSHATATMKTEENSALDFLSRTGGRFHLCFVEGNSHGGVVSRAHAYSAPPLLSLCSHDSPPPLASSPLPCPTTFVRSGTTRSKRRHLPRLQVRPHRAFLPFFSRS